MNSDQKFVGDWEIIEPKKMVKLGFVMDEYKLPHAEKLWKEAEEKALKIMPLFKKDELFHQETSPYKTGLVVQTRFYTAESNRRKIQGG